ncbi:uncharacterized protein K452DRAFT_293377 [Aplosporella prunicola CBS 121167]|uniref:Oxidoreductase n=1 Tax=Aplosporella prunicola CBS 121167 TaxID=1176127 RepID=A0A6A6AXE9_9PEZI|nr:uncharacterized protein K452DRAFT_293377 [Aplosporella prunicola CBS 121167]KAF2135231.1 hypothetical protein K452DRAFT_293377 [Aplosporella prunicola CBS 121167]
MTSVDFLPSRDIPSLTGKVIFITGGTSGLGAESVQQLAQKQPRAIYLSGRNAKNAEALIERVKAVAPTTPLHFIQCDLASLPSVAAAAAQFLAASDRLDILMCNAGIMAHPPGLTSDGYELQFGINFLGHALLIKKLLPLLQRTAQLPGADVRVVLLTSLGFLMHPRGGILFDSLRTTQDSRIFGPWTRYGQSKLAALLYARELARRAPSILAIAVHPGVVQTGLADGLSAVNRVFLKAMLVTTKLVTPEEGARNQLWAATTQREGIENAALYEPVGVLSGKLDKTSKDDALAGRLWEWTEKELERY